MEESRLLGYFNATDNVPSALHFSMVPSATRSGKFNIRSKSDSNLSHGADVRINVARHFSVAGHILPLL